MRETHGSPKLPEGYRLDFAVDPDVAALRRPDGTVVARFSIRGMSYEALEREALEDLPTHAGLPSIPSWEGPSGRTSENTYSTHSGE